MTYEIYSFAHINLPKIIVDQQFKVFDKFGLKINQIINDDTHGKNLENVEGTFDLIVANPPHWPSSEAAANTLGFDSTQFEHIEDILVDPNWHSHKEFFIKAKSLLATNGRILLQENYTGSTPETFRLMVQQAGLKISTYTKSEMYNDIYYLEVIHEQRL